MVICWACVSSLSPYEYGFSHPKSSRNRVIILVLTFLLRLDKFNNSRLETVIKVWSTGVVIRLNVIWEVPKNEIEPSICGLLKSYWRGSGKMATHINARVKIFTRKKTIKLLLDWLFGHTKNYQNIFKTGSNYASPFRVILHWPLPGTTPTPGLNRSKRTKKCNSAW